MAALAALVSVALVAIIVVGGLILLRGAFEGFNRCPYCRSRIPRRAIVCARCGRNLHPHR